ncbi:xanthine dehydrogenase family protein subunit M [Christensenellaceae bacterium OttesenSCG-928-M15]|nr:xanthine dehydrogenase family protein subunit M [Christensenellaceae bacterium OttesenSCG-928-M15]
MRDFKYRKALCVKEALDILAEEKENAYIIAGGTNVLPNIRSEWRTSGTLVDISWIKEMRGVKLDGDTITVGPLTTISDLEESDVLQQYAPVLAQVAIGFADPSTRHSATVGGNIINASPAADCAAPLLVLDAVLTLEKQGEKREVPITEFFMNKGQTVMGVGELMTAITFKKTPNSAFYKLGGRKAMSISAANFAVALEPDGNKVKNVKIATGCLSPFPCRAKATEALLEGKELTQELLDKVDETLNAGDINPHSGLRASEPYRRVVAPVFVCRLLKQAYSANGGAK